MGEFNLSAGIAAREKGKDAVTDNNKTFVSSMRNFARDHIEREGSVTTDDLRAYATKNGIAPNHPNAWGAVFRGVEFEEIGWKRSVLVSNHARKIRVWKLR